MKQRNKLNARHFLLWVLMILFIVATHKVNAQQIKIVYPGYTSYFNTKTLIPDSVIYTATKHKKVADREAGFHSDGKEPNMNVDYAHSGYDIGHFCNASDENGNAADEYNSFAYCNVAPQLPKLNRLTWLALENYIRSISSIVKVKIYWSGVKGHIGKDNVTVPLYCIKEIWYNGKHEKYVMPNQDSVTKHLFTFYKVKP